MSAIKEAIKAAKGFTPSNMLKEGLKNTVGIVADKGFGILEKVQEGKISIAEGQQELEAFKLQMQADAADAAVEMDKAYLADVQNARNLQINALNQNDKLAKRFIYYLAMFIVGAAVIFGVGLFFVTIPEHNKHLVQMFADVFLFSGALIVLNFFFGSSKNEKDKDDSILSNK